MGGGRELVRQLDVSFSYLQSESIKGQVIQYRGLNNKSGVEGQHS